MGLTFIILIKNVMLPRSEWIFGEMLFKIQRAYGILLKAIVTNFVGFNDENV